MKNYHLQNFSPIWAKPGKIRLNNENPSMARWEPIQVFLKTLGDLLGVEIAIIDTDYLCVAGTGPYEKSRGFFIPKDTALGFSLQSGEWAVVLNPGVDDACIACSIKDRCRDQANYTGPLNLNGKVVGALQFVAFNHHQRIILIEKAERTIRLACQLVEQFYESSIIGWRVENESFPFSGKDFLSGRNRFEEITGKSPPMLRLKEQILQASQAASTVLISGESGTGKELIAKALHKNGLRRDEPFIAINCGAIPETLIESELFGYIGGAFSGARAEGHKGLLRLADRGTIFFDEISDLPLNMQVKLLRFLQEHEIMPVGSNQTIQVDVRVIAASNRKLYELVKKGLFRSDLYYRLNVIPLTVPPLRERRSDIPILAQHFIDKFITWTDKKKIGITNELMRSFEAYSWPGNVREFKNFIEYGVQFCKGEMLTREMMAHRFETTGEFIFKEHFSIEHQKAQTVTSDLIIARKQAEQEQVSLALEKFGHSVKGKKAAAQQLDISLSTLYRILKRKNKNWSDHEPPVPIQ